MNPPRFQHGPRSFRDPEWEQIQHALDEVLDPYEQVIEALAATVPPAAREQFNQAVAAAHVAAHEHHDVLSDAMQFVRTGKC